MIVMLVVQSQSDTQFASAQTEQRQGPRTKTQRSLSEARILEWRWTDMKKWNANSPLTKKKKKKARHFDLSLKCGEIIASFFFGWTFLKPTIVLVSSWMFRRREQGSAAPPTWFSYDSCSFLSCKLSFWVQLHPEKRQPLAKSSLLKSTTGIAKVYYRYTFLLKLRQYTWSVFFRYYILYT